MTQEIDKLVIEQCKRLLWCIKKKDIAEGNAVINALKLLLDSSIQEVELTFDTPKIYYAGYHFCLTGEFEYGEREEVEAAICAKGGKVLRAVSKNVDYLIVGSEGSEDWVHQNYGRKLEKALALRHEGLERPQIIHEHHWIKTL